MKISACYIVKNEEKNIRNSLDSIKNYVDEIIAVDTGSTDKTREIFREYGALIYEQPWKDDFATPRNLALSKATGDWIILLDADESFTSITSKNLRDVILENYNVDALLINKINIDITDNSIKDSFYDLRIARNQKGLTYVGRIHEVLTLNGETLSNVKYVSQEQLTIIHTGYSSDFTEAKAQRNLSILLSEMKEGRNPAECYTYLAECYDAIGDIDNMLRYAKLDVAQGRRPVTYASRSYRKLLNYYIKNGKPDERMNIVQQAVKDFPELPEFHAELAVCYTILKEYKKAIEELKLAIKMYGKYHGIEPCLLNDDDISKMKQHLDELKRIVSSKKNNIKISACLICKNEAENIELWINNSRIFADEIIIVDTGSTDDTLKIIAANEIMHYDYEWQNNFSDAKNFAIEHASGDWIVFTDADEMFVNPDYVRWYLQNLDSEIDAIMVPLSNIDEDLHGIEINRFNAIRMFRRDDSIKFFGKIHEALSNVSTPGDIGSLRYCIADENLLIRHTGYSRSKIKSKLQRNKKLLEDDIEINGLQDRHYRYLAENYFGLGEYGQALKYGFLAVDSPMQAVGQQSDMYWLVANCLELLGYDVEERMALLKIAMQLYPDLPDFYGAYGLLLLEMENDEAYDFLAKSLQIYIKHDDKVNSTNYQQIIAMIYSGMGMSYFKKGDNVNSVEYFKKALSINKWLSDAIIGLSDLYDSQPVPKLMDILEDIYEYSHDEQARKMLIDIFDDNGVIDIVRELRGKDCEYYCMLRNGDYDDLSKELPADIVNTMQELFISLLGIKYDKADYSTRQQIQLLPGSFGKIVQAYHTDIPLSDDIFDEYSSVITSIILHQNFDIKCKYLLMASSFTDENIIKIAKIALDNELWEIAFVLYQQISIDSSVIDNIFWLNVGKCLFHIGNYVSARECFEKVVSEFTDDNKNEVTSYLAWCQEAIA